MGSSPPRFEAEAEHHRHDDHGVEPAGLAEVPGETLLAVEWPRRSAYAVEPASTGYREQPEPDDPEREDEAGEVAGDRLQRRAAWSAVAIVVMPTCERRAGGHDDREHDRDRRRHPADHVDAHRDEVFRRHRVPGLVAAGFDLLLDLFARLPEEEVRRDGGPEDRDERRDLGPVGVERRDETAQHGAPVDVDDDEHDDVGARARWRGTRRIRAYRWYDTKISSTSIVAAITTVSTAEGNGMTRWADAPIAARSAAMLNVFAVATRTTQPSSTQRGSASGSATRGRGR